MMECENGICKLSTAKPTTGAAAGTTTTDSAIVITTPAIPDQLKALPWSHLVDGTGKHVSTSALQRPLTVYLFSAAWCGPCGEVAPTIEALHKAHHETDLDIVYVGFDRTLDEHLSKFKLPYFKFTWFQDEKLQTPIPVEYYADQPENVNPFRLEFRAVLESLGKMGIPAIIVVDCATGKIIDGLATLSLFHVTGSKTLDADLAAIVARWRSGQPASTRWMRTKSAVIGGVLTFVLTYLVFPVANAIDWVSAKLSKSTKVPAKSDPEVKAKDLSDAQQQAAVECEGGVCRLPAAKKDGPTKAA